MSSFLKTTIRWSFYLLFFLVPLVFYAGSNELFEYNKMMLTYGLTIIIAAAWGMEMLYERKIIFRRTFLDLPIVLYLLSHIISTVTSIDFHTSVWGYYSRFHEGLLATISYIILYYALVSNLDKKAVYKIFYASFASAVVVCIWGIYEHFGSSFSCLAITGQFNDSCWIQDVKNRVFATLGQPNWMAAYLDVLLLSVFGFLFSDRSSSVVSLSVSHNRNLKTRNQLWSFVLVSLGALFFAALLFTKSRSGILGLFAGFGIFGLGIILIKRTKALELLKNKFILTVAALIIALSFTFGLPVPYLEKINLTALLSQNQKAVEVAKPKTTDGFIDIGISESGDIRKIVWKGAIKIWQRYPIFGSGVETFAYAYYKDRPVEHNYVSEWDFLYNKAHNEFLNLLATTGTVGMLAYLSILAVFSWWILKRLTTSDQPLVTSDYLVIALFAAYVSIWVTNFFGFSVVIIGIYFFLIPGFSLILSLPENIPQPLAKNNQQVPKSPETTTLGWIGICGFILVAIIMEWNLMSMWQADKDFAYGKNLDGVSQFGQANNYLVSAVQRDPAEPTFKDELSFNEAVLASSSFDQASGSAEIKKAGLRPYIDIAVRASDDAVSEEPNNLTFWKTRTKVFYQLSNIDQNYMLQSLAAITKAVQLAPTDPKVRYNYGLILGRVGQTQEAVKAFEETVALKADYADARYALGLYYAQLGQKDKAREQMEFMLKRIGADERAQKWLDENK